MIVRARLLAPALGLLLFPTPLTAQTMPVPSLPAEPRESETTPPATRPGPSPYLEAFQTPARTRPWEYAVAIGTGWNSNIDFDAARLRSGASVTPQGGLARVFSSSGQPPPDVGPNIPTRRTSGVTTGTSAWRATTRCAAPACGAARPTGSATARRPRS